MAKKSNTSVTENKTTYRLIIPGSGLGSRNTVYEKYDDAKLEGDNFIETYTEYRDKNIKAFHEILEKDPNNKGVQFALKVAEEQTFSYTIMEITATRIFESGKY